MEQLNEKFELNPEFSAPATSDFMQSWINTYGKWEGGFGHNPNIWHVSLHELMCAMEFHGGLPELIEVAARCGIYIQVTDATVTIENDGQPLVENEDGLIDLEVTFTPKEKVSGQGRYYDEAIPSSMTEHYKETFERLRNIQPGQGNQFWVEKFVPNIGLDPAAPGRDVMVFAIPESLRSDPEVRASLERLVEKNEGKIKIVPLEQLINKDPIEENIKGLRILLDGHSVIDQDFIEMARVLEQPAAPEPTVSKGPRRQSKYKRGGWWNN